MSTSASVSTLMADILHHTPHRVWAILAAITVLGLMQWRQHSVSRGRLLLAPIVLGAYSLWSAGSVLGAVAVPAWLAGLTLAGLAGQTLQPGRPTVRTADGRLVIGGSPWPLLLMWTVFALRYVAAVAQVFHPELARNSAAAIGLAVLYGTLSGLFAARAWRVLQSARWPASAQAA
ncbi:MAG TPA: DUF6622 family protein [Burkholderiaceae bacterium]|nr:DUF6622 family protein [Burkholderiaceae bacterium]